MSQFPPPPPMGPVGYAPPQYRPATNTWAVVSLVCGIVGCLVITPIIAIVAGLVGIGRSRLQGGRGMAVTGLILGILWCVGGSLLIGGGVWLWINGAEIIAKEAKPQTIALINRVANGDTSRDAVTGKLTDADLQALAAAAVPMGPCQDISISRSGFFQTNNDLVIEFGGTATFQNGTKTIDARMHMLRGAGQRIVAFEKLELK